MRSELHIGPAACHHLAALTRALPRLARNDDAHHIAAAAHWKRLEAEQQPVRACTLCTRHRSHGTTDTAWVHRPPHRLVCPRHHQAAPNPRLTTTVRTWAAPELATAHHAHQRFLRHPRAITTRWYDHQQHLTHRWHTRLSQLCATNPHLTSPRRAAPPPHSWHAT